MKIVWQAIVATIIPNIGGFAGGFLTARAIKDWYNHLNQPVWTPPNWIFGPMWTLLYCLMGFASYLVWRDGGGFKGKATLPLAAYGIQLIINWVWTPIFFGGRSVEWGFYWIVLVWIAAVISAVLMFRVNKIAGYLMIPYILWVSYATTVSFGLWRMNLDGGKIYPEQIKNGTIT